MGSVTPIYEIAEQYPFLAGWMYITFSFGVAIVVGAPFVIWDKIKSDSLKRNFEVTPPWKM